ncbi:patatin-like phospholipase family protein [Psychrobacter sanguinis]|uniref:Patatin-like phospholipase family protein n=1 Tax=Psychrobacter sanguinis TaxID=861445 RepID=A0A844M1B9_9GAMM|nr:patatin-like phospholipase family protein [Psychrobacter sanguinis]MUG32751.1 patatin-like phospholipase family protein [Psychrobacter sanguinis]
MRTRAGLPFNGQKTGLTCVAVMASTLLVSACHTSSVASGKSGQHVATSTASAPTIALVLGGGGAKGFAHVGVIKALEANNLHPNLVVGTSVGSFVGSLYASGKSAAELERIARTTADSELTDFTLAYQGIIEGNKLRDFVNLQVNNQPIEAFPIRFGAVAAEKHSLAKTVFTQGEAGLAVQASSSVPNVFIAPRIPDPKTSGIVGKKYIDGGVVSIVPVDSAKALGADIVIAVDLQINKNKNTSPSGIKDANRSLWSLIEQGYNSYLNSSAKDSATQAYRQHYAAINEAEIGRADVVIRPDVANISAITTLDREKAIAAGAAATEQNLPAIRAAIAKAHVQYRLNN